MQNQTIVKTLPTLGQHRKKPATKHLFPVRHLNPGTPCLWHSTDHTRLRQHGHRYRHLKCNLKCVKTTGFHSKIKLMRFIIHRTVDVITLNASMRPCLQQIHFILSDITMKSLPSFTADLTYTPTNTISRNTIYFLDRRLRDWTMTGFYFSSKWITALFGIFYLC
jgi:hypothetical protein